MAGSHRTEISRSGLARHTPLILIAVGVLAIVGFVWWSLAGTEDHPQPPPSVQPTPVPTSAPPSPSPSADKSGASDVSGIDDLPRIPGDSPKRLVIGDAVDAGFSSAVATGGDELEAPSSSDLTRVEDRGEPGSPGEDTVVIIGQDRFDQQAALNDIADVRKGDTIELETYNAQLTYTVTSTFKVASGNITSSSMYTDERPGRLMLVATTYSDSGNRTGADTVVIAQLTAAKAN